MNVSGCSDSLILCVCLTVGVCVCVDGYVSMFMAVCQCVNGCVSLWGCVSNSESVCVWVTLWVSEAEPIDGLVGTSVSVCECGSESLSMCEIVCVCLCDSLSVSVDHPAVCQLTAMRHTKENSGGQNPFLFLSERLHTFNFVQEMSLGNSYYCPINEPRKFLFLFLKWSSETRES